MRFFFSLSLILCLIIVSKSQEPIYFNNIYQNQDNFAVGLTILETGDGYVGYGGTEDPNNIGQMLLLFKIDKQGEELIWKPFGENYHSYYPGNIGGAMVITHDDNFALACHYGYNDQTFASLIKLDYNLDTLWKKDYNFQTYTVGLNCIEVQDHGFLISGWTWESGANTDALIIKTDSTGDYQWHKFYGDELVEYGLNTNETPDGGYLIGGLKWEAGIDHSLDAMVIKTDSLGNEEWTQYYGNPDVDDDMALVAVADDGNYLLATVYGEWVITPDARTGRLCLIKIDHEGNIIWQKKIGPKMRTSYIKNLRFTFDNNLIASGFFMDDTTSNYIYKGFICKFSQEGDSIWMRDYNQYNNQYDMNFFYDVYPTSDNGYIATGQAHPDMDNNKLWIVKVDSLGCDTPGCATGVQVFDWPEYRNGFLDIWPNPASGVVTLSLSKCDGVEKQGIIIKIYNSQGSKVKEIRVLENVESLQVNVSAYSNGLYYLQYIQSNQVMGTIKFIKN